MTVRIYLLLLFTLLGGCGAENTIRERAPDLPVIDIGAHDIHPSYFVFRLAIEPATQGKIFVSQSVTYTGYVYDDWRNQFTIHVPDTIFGIDAGQELYTGSISRRLYAGDFNDLDVDHPFAEGDHGIVTAAAITISPTTKEAGYYYENSAPFTVGVSTQIFTTDRNVR
ncbi:MAG: hypothetical protein OXN17_18950 [Candidatus Poribacteria bacterium]|nr:hypothetical protein [Candidatus Poribacteria bacterium]MDE0503807.1 hypothetical protein [Candidatus Poribacteria bacterium]